MGIALAAGLTLALVMASVLIHYEVLYGASRLIPRLSIPVRARMPVVIAACVTAHVLEISLFAAAYGSMDAQLGMGTISGATAGSALDLFYFSATTFTTLGFGDLNPLGALRIVASLESLTGLVLIGWSASFTYLSMQEFWEEHRSFSRSERPGRLPGTVLRRGPLP